MEETVVAFVDDKGGGTVVETKVAVCQRCGSEMLFIFDDIVCPRCDFKGRKHRHRADNQQLGGK